MLPAFSLLFIAAIIWTIAGAYYYAEKWLLEDEERGK